MLTALCGSLVLVLFWGCLRRVVTPQALLTGLVLLAFQADLVMLSRVAVPEMPLMFLELVIYFIIVAGGTSWRMVAAGLLMLVLIVMKLTTLLYLPIFSIIIVFMPRNTASGSERWRDLQLFWISFATPIAIGGLVGYFFLSKGLPTFQNHVWGLWIAISKLLALANFYNVISFPFEHSLSHTLNLWALGLWISVLGWLARDRVSIDFQSRRYLTTSAIWFTLYLIVMLSLGYFPSRYKVHILLPMVLFIVVGISQLQRLGIRKVIDFLAEVKGLRVSMAWSFEFSNRCFSFRLC